MRARAAGPRFAGSSPGGTAHRCGPHGATRRPGPGLRLRGDLIDVKAPDGVIRQTDDGRHGPIRAAVSEVCVIDLDGTVRQLVEDPVGQIVVLRPWPPAVQRTDETPGARTASRGV